MSNQWTTTPPTEPGWYWTQDLEATPINEMDLVYVGYLRQEVYGVVSSGLWAWYFVPTDDSEASAYSLEEYIDVFKISKWLGPLQAPQVTE